jgi:hypothetical protein
MPEYLSLRAMLQRAEHGQQMIPVAEQRSTATAEYLH